MVPDTGVAAVLADAGLVLEPDFYRAGQSGPGKRSFDQTGEFFLNPVPASGSFLG